MRKHLLAAILLVVALVPAGALPAAPPGNAGKPEEPVRELYVPFEDLSVLLESGPRRVLLTRGEYDDLLKRARKTADQRAPREALLASADYEVLVGEERAQIRATLSAAVLEDGLHAVGLDLSGVGLARADLGEGTGAPIGRADDGRLMLFVEGKGRHELRLEMVAPMQTTAARQILSVRLPAPPAARMRLTVPGDVEVKSGAAVVSRVFDEKAEQTRFELLPPRGPMNLVMSLNSRLRRRERLVLARSVLLDEVTRACERFRATVSMAVLHMAVDKFRFSVPRGFEITEVTSPHLSRWEIAAGADGVRWLDVFLREETTETVVVRISATRTRPALGAWTFPRLEPQEVVGHMAVVGLLLEDRLKVEAVQAGGLIPIDVSVLGRGLLQATADGESAATRPVVAYFAPHAAFDLKARFVKPPAEILVTTNLLLLLEDRRQTVRGGFAVLPREEKLFALDFSAPPGWEVTGVTGDDKKGLPFERYPEAGGGSRLHVGFPAGVPVGQETRVYFEAVSVPRGWLGDWAARPIAFPVFAVSGATRDIGAIAVLASDDMQARPDAVSNLTWLDENEMAKYGLAGTGASLAYRYDARPYSARLTVERIAPRLTARTYSFFRVDRDNLVAHYELAYDVVRARARTLLLDLPDTTPEKLSIRGLGGARVKEFTSAAVDGGVRRWTAHLAERAAGTVRLAVDFEQPLGGIADQRLSLPIVRAAGVGYQSGFVSVEGNAELDVQILEPLPREVDAGELVDAEYQPGRRLLGVYSFVGDRATMRINVSRRAGYGLPSAIVQRVLMATVLAADGISQTEARFSLRTKAQFLKVVLPEGSEFWSATLDGKPTKPQRDRRSLLVSLSADGDRRTRDLHIVYQSRVGPLGFWSRRDLPAPQLTLHAGPGSAGVRVPVADLLWQLYLPTGYEAVRSEGSVVTDDLPVPTLAVAQLPGHLLDLGGGTGFDRGLLGMLTSVGPSLGTRYFRGLAITDDYAGRSGEAPDAMAVQTGPGRPQEGGEEVESEESGVPSNEIRRRPSTDEWGKLREARPAMKDSSWSLDPLRAETVDADVDREKSRRTTGTPATPDLSPSDAPSEAAPPPAGEPRGGGGPERPSVPAKPSSGRPEGRTSSSRAMLGARSLAIVLEPTGEPITFTNLGADPVLDVTIVQRRRLDPLALGLALAVFLGGLAQANRSAGRKTAYIIIVALVATLVPVLVGKIELALALNASFNAACLLVPAYLVIGLVRWMVRASRGRRTSVATSAAATTAAVVLLAVATVLGGAAPAGAKEPLPAGGGGGKRPYVIQIVEPAPSVKVPKDALVVPYDPASPDGPAKADRLLVPYERFVELWNLAYPEKKIGTEKPPADYALAGAAFSATLAGEEFLLVEGHVDLDVFVDGYAEVPLALAGGVLAKADLDGSPARMRVVEVGVTRNVQARQAERAQQRQAAPQPAGEQGMTNQAWREYWAQRLQQTAASQQAAAVNQSTPNNRALPPPRVPVLVVYVSGKGRHRLDLAVRLKLQRRGGWRVAEGILPAGPATALTLSVPEAATEVRLSGVQDRRTYETVKAGEVIATALVPRSPLSVQWRPKVAEAQVDRGLTAESAARVDLREDQLRVVWTVSLSFRRGQREFFSLDLPEGYLVEKVEGTNVRGWQLRDPADGRRKLEVSLLKQAKDNERLTVFMWRPEAFKAGTPRAVDIPVVQVAGAVRHSGSAVIYRSPLLDVRVLEARGATRTDVVALEQGNVPDVGAGDSPLGVRLYQSYRFAAAPFTLRLEAVPVEVQAEAGVEMLLKVAERERILECRARVSVEKRPLHLVRMIIPQDLELDAVLAPGEFEWAVYSAGAPGVPAGARLLVVYLATGQVGEVSIILQGKLGETRPLAAVDVPRIEVLGVRRQQGDIVVQADPAFDVHADRSVMKNLETVPLGRTYTWLASGQRRLAALALHYKRPDYAGRLVLTARTPKVNCYTVTNVRVTDRALEEMILLDFGIENAGIREVAFRLPDWMRDARVRVPGLRLQTVEDAPGGMVRIRLELQDQLLGRLRVLVENDRLLTSGTHEAPIPVVETGTTDSRYVALESAGRDEVVVEAADGIDTLGRQQAEWRRVAGLLQGGMTQAYLVRPGAEKPRLTFSTRKRKTVKTAEARIGLAWTLLVVDSSGAYRGQVVYHVDNRTEQYLEIELPEGAELWTAQVAGRPVKPVKSAAAGKADGVLLPLVKTEEGDLDYPVVLKYAGTMGDLGGLGTEEFPLVRTVNVHVERSQVELLLPTDYAWFLFRGTMRQEGQAGDLEAEIAGYQKEQVTRLMEAAASANPFAQARAQANLKNLSEQITFFNDAITQSVRGRDNRNLQLNVSSNTLLLKQAEQTLKAQDEAGGKQLYLSNAGNLWKAYGDQYVQRDRNIVQDSGANWEAERPEGVTARAPDITRRDVVVADGDGRFNAAWLDSNKLAAQPPARGETARTKLGIKSDVADMQKSKGARQLRRQPQAADVKPLLVPPGKGKPTRTDWAGDKAQGKVREDQRQVARRYQYKLEQQQQSGQVATGPGQVAPLTHGRPQAERVLTESERRGVRFGDLDKTVAGYSLTYGTYAGTRVTTATDGGWGGGGSGAVPTGLASLVDVELPRRGRLYRFTTLSGDVRITAKAASVEFLGSLKRVLGVLIAIAVALWVRRLIARGTFRGVAGDVLAIVLIVLGGIGLFFGLLPIAGLVALTAGIIWKVALTVRRRREAAQAANAAAAA